MKVRTILFTAFITGIALMVPAVHAQHAGFSVGIAPAGQSPAVGSFATSSVTIQAFPRSPILPMSNPIAPMTTAPVLIPPDGVLPRLSSDLLAVDSPRLQSALRMIREQACEGLNVKELLRKIPISRRSLEEQFQRHLHRSPRDEIIRVRLQQARSLLSRTDLSMALVAERCGFGNAERLSVVFHQVEGCTPTSYRKRYRLN
jgi:AraC-like DNA-binding protein